ncbi:prepilin-type N-terminal cleavage/methylation domain-containing protein [Candidatus Parcubacteria bacterium]|nr:prepilin-type N-terminal cleavage/methylation domain-containing protein [Candidatus Parcubacteria bacterium]
MNKNIAFTLVELLVVVSIIGVLSGLIIAVLNPAVFKGRARDGVRMQDLAVIKGGLEQYYSENNTYPGATSQLAPTYLKVVPADPQGGSYVYTPSGANYCLCANVEDVRNIKLNGCGSGQQYCVTNPF